MIQLTASELQGSNIVIEGAIFEYRLNNNQLEAIPYGLADNGSRLRNQVSLTLNNQTQPLTLSHDSTFRQTLTLQQGRNQIALTALNSSGTTTTPTLERTLFPPQGSFAGQLTYGSDAQLATHAKVTLTDAKGDGRMTRTDSDGRYQFSGLIAGESYRLSASYYADSINYRYTDELLLTAPANSRLTLPTLNLSAVETTFTGAPLVVLNPLIAPDENGSLTFSGQIANYDATLAGSDRPVTLLINGQSVAQLTVTLTDGVGSFSGTHTLTEADNQIAIRATNLNGLSSQTPPQLSRLDLTHYGAIGLTINASGGIGSQGRLQIFNSAQQLTVDRQITLTGEQSVIEIDRLAYDSYHYQLALNGYLNQSGNFIVNEPSRTVTAQLTAAGIDLSWISQSVTLRPYAEDPALAHLSGNYTLEVPTSRVAGLNGELGLSALISHNHNLGTQQLTLSLPTQLPPPLSSSDTTTRYLIPFNYLLELVAGENRFKLTTTTRQASQETLLDSLTYQPQTVDLNNQPPLAYAGEDQSVISGDRFTLTGQGSDSDGSLTAYLWQQLDGPTLPLSDPTLATIELTAPTLTERQSAIFELTVFDNQNGQGSDIVIVEIEPRLTLAHPFELIAQSDVRLNTVIESNPITVSGINVAVPLTISGGEYRIDQGSYTTADGSVTNGQTVTVRHTSSSSHSSQTDTILTLGGISDTFTTTTLDDTTPDAFSFTDQTGVALTTPTESNTLTITGLNAATPISISGGEYRIDSGNYTTEAGTLNNNQTVTLRQTSASSFSTLTTATLTIGGVEGSFSLTTLAAITAPEAFSFNDQQNVALNSVIESNPITVNGINTVSTLTISGGEYRIDQGNYTTADGSVTNGQTVTVRHTSSSSHSSQTDTILTIGGISDTFTTTTLDDTVPDAFSFIAQTGVALTTPTESNTLTITGLNAATPISISGGEYRIDSGNYTTEAGTLNNNQTVTLRQTSASSFSTLTTATLTIGGVEGSFSLTTLAAITAPEAFSFNDQQNVALNSVIESNPITVNGINTVSTLTISGGEYRIDQGNYTTADGSVTNGQTVTVRHTSSSSHSSQTDTILTIGGISDTFTTTTLDDTTPDAFSFTDQTGVALSTLIESNTITVAGINAATAISISGGEYKIDAGSYTSTAGTVLNGQTVTVRHTSSASHSSQTDTILTLGGISDTFTTTTLDDTTPDAFSFTDQTGVALSTLIESNTITVAGINAATAISISGGEYKIDAGSYTSTAGTVLNGQTVTVRHTSSASHSSQTDTILTLGGISDTFTTTTLDDTTPDAFSFTDQTGVALSTLIESNTITVAGINAATAISISGGEYKIDAGSYTSTAGTVLNGQTVTVRHTSSASHSSQTDTILTLGGISDTFTTTTTLDDTTPDAFSFIAQTGVPRATVTESNAITVSGLSVGAEISVIGGEYQIDGGGYSAITGTVQNGQTVQLRHTSSADYATLTTTTLTIGGVEASFSTTTEAEPAQPATRPLNDTGLLWGGNYPSGNNGTCIGETIEQQDCSHGRDAQALAGTLTKVGGGHGGFDFTKLGANGEPLAIQTGAYDAISGSEAAGTLWRCVKDNLTGLIWEVKTDDGGIHDKDNTYRWGGVTALLNGDFGTRYNDWDTLVNGSNSEALCGFSDWRVPSIRELESIRNLNRANPAIDTAYFPNTLGSFVWSASANANYSDDAWVVYFYYGNSYNDNRTNSYGVRLVRSGQ
ncbi:DUF1566 domain-containing protein [Ectothiorhodospiraceae bacterium BW-2]|nr:DUF1566 domain-containing protein [Ectothiorhodospiraceae bacterium BW-2]